MSTIYTIGHSTRPLQELTEALCAHGIRILVDIRAYPASRRMPWFQGPQHPPFMNDAEAEVHEALETTLPRAGIEYCWMKSLGGRRRKILDPSPNLALHGTAFRNYADYMLTSEFAAAAADLLRRAKRAPTAIMCAEAQVYWHCHRMLVSDFLAAHGCTVLHIRDAGSAKSHKMTPEARVQDGHVIYDAGTLPFAVVDLGGRSSE